MISLLLSFNILEPDKYFLLLSSQRRALRPPHLPGQGIFLALKPHKAFRIGTVLGSVLGQTCSPRGWGWGSASLGSGFCADCSSSRQRCFLVCVFVIASVFVICICVCWDIFLCVYIFLGFSVYLPCVLEFVIDIRGVLRL